MDKNLQKYQALAETITCGSFTKAAERLHYSQSGISRMIADLETEWNVSLLERSRAGVQLTSEGEQLLPYVLKVCESFEALQRQVDEINGLETGLLRIGTFSSVATHWLPRIIRAFQNVYPGIEFELLLGDYTEIETWIQNGRVDCGFLRLPTIPSLETELLEEDPLLVVLPEGHPLAEREKISVKTLCDYPFILLERNENDDVSAVFEACGKTPDVRFTTWDDYAVMAMVESGLGISVLPKLILQRVSYRIAVRELEQPAYRKIGIALRNRERAPLVLARFLDFLQYREETDLEDVTRTGIFLRD